MLNYSAKYHQHGLVNDEFCFFFRPVLPGDFEEANNKLDDVIHHFRCSFFCFAEPLKLLRVLCNTYFVYPTFSWKLLL